jgi:hypothetical protein
MGMVVCSDPGGHHDGPMLRIATDLLPQSLLSYVAFRTALRCTEAALEEHGVDWYPDDSYRPVAYLVEVPYLREVPLTVQLEVLAETWDRHLAREVYQATLVDEAVVYAACEFAARLAEHQPEQITWALRGGPVDVTVPVDAQLASELRNLYLRMSNEGDFLLVSQFLDLAPEESADWKERLGLSETRLQTLFDLLARWQISPDVIGNLQGLVSIGEVQSLARRLGVAMPA